MQDQNRTALVLGAGGFIGSHMVSRLRSEGYYVRGVDIKYPEYSTTDANEFIIADLRDKSEVSKVMFSPFQKSLRDVFSFDEVYQFAAWMGGAGVIFTGDNDSEIMYNSATINLNVAFEAVRHGVKKIFFSSSACMYPQEIQEQENNPGLKESDAWPAHPDSSYGLEKLFSEEVYNSYARNNNLNIRIARYHNIFGSLSTWKGGKEKSPAAICRKVAEANDGGEIEIWGDGKQRRSFLHISECLEATRRLMQSNYNKPVNIGSDKDISINELAHMVIAMSGKNISIKNVPSNALGVRGRNSDNTLIKEILGWSPSLSLIDGMAKLFSWVDKQVAGG